MNDPFSFYSVTQVVEAVKGFVSGFYFCSPDHAHLTAAIGVNNFGSQVTGRHGSAWAQAVNEINAWIDSSPSMSGKVHTWGAIDAEMSWNSGVVTIGWVNGYKGQAATGNFYVDFGTCESCPTQSVCQNTYQILSGPPTYPDKPAWTCDEIWYVAWGALPAQPIPEIYLESGANSIQWQHLSQYAAAKHGRPIVFKGTLTQWNACQENRSTDPSSCIYENDRADITPQVGYTQFYQELLKEPSTAETVSTLWWSTDMSWVK